MSILVQLIDFTVLAIQTLSSSDWLPIAF